MRLAVAADAGCELKLRVVPWLKSLGHEILDLGAHKLDSDDDYPDFAAAVARAVMADQAERGVLICGSGVGACITANKIKGIRACLCHDTYSARQGVEHDSMNVICIGGRIIGFDQSKEILISFIGANFLTDARFQRRLDKLNEVERLGT